MAAFFTGRLRGQYFSDVTKFSDDVEGTTQIASGYLCLAAAIGWGISFFSVLAFNPSHVEAHVLALIGAVGGVYGFLQIRRRRDPRVVMSWMVIGFLVSAAIISFNHAGIIAPIMASLPAVAGISSLYLQGTMRRSALLLVVAVTAFGFLTAAGVIGIPTTYTPRSASIMMLGAVLLSAIFLGGIAWITQLARDYAVERVKDANSVVIESAARSRVALEAAKVGLWDVPDAELRRFHVSESFESITGYNADEFNDIFNRIEQFVHLEDVTQLREAFALGRNRLSRIRVDFRLNTKTRGYRWFSARARYSRNEDGTIRISGSLQDINFIKAAEDALRTGRDKARVANKAKSDFIATMSHEVRTPLNAILGSVEVLERGTHDQETAELVTLIGDAGRGLLTIVNDLLDVSKIEAGKLEISPSPTDVCALLTRTVDFWRPQASSKGLSLVVDCSQADGGALMVDAGRVRQIIGNLVSNAIKFTDAGGVTASLSTHETRDGRVEAIISVIDTGPGIPTDAVETIFAPFEQGPTNGGRGGTGLGLFISRRLARLMGGDLTLEPARRSGSNFRLSLAVQRASDTDTVDIDVHDDPIWTGKHVLVVDDNENNRRIAQLLLSKLGIEVTLAASGPEAIDLCAMTAFDAILMDIVMPDMTGFETLRQLRGDASCPNQPTPAIALTAKLAAEDIADYAAAGFDGVAGKPINVRELVQSLAPFMVGRAKTSSD
ncbi:MAG TPA: ATP-binding protein [Hyphomonadaceae bacterium]|nr:ATP-binding protein [Hyphomonadaceae bacterium]